MRFDPGSDLTSTRVAGGGSTVRMLILLCAISGLIAFAFARPELIFSPTPAGDQRTAALAGATPTASAAGSRENVYRAGPNGHFRIDAYVNGAAVQFLFDSGASDIALSRRDAERLDIDLHRLDYVRVYNTANGVVRGAPVTLREIRVGQAVYYDVAATVIEADMAVSLLGMSFLSRLDGFEVAKDKLILRW